MTRGADLFPLRVACIDHGAVLRSYRRRYVALASLGGIEVLVIAPSNLREPNYDGMFEDLDASEQRYRLVVFPFIGGKAHRGIFPPAALYRCLHQFRPHVVYTQSEPEAFLSGQLLAVTSLLPNHPPLVLSSWATVNLRKQGWPYRLRVLHTLVYDMAVQYGAAATVYCDEAERILRVNGFRGFVQRLPWGIDVDMFRPVARTLSRGVFRVGFVGRLEAEKGGDILLLAAKRAGVALEVALAGEGRCRSQWQELARALQVPAHFSGVVPNEELPGFLSELDVLVLPSRSTPTWTEQFGKVLVEAMACGVPVVGARTGAIPAVIGEAGELFPEADVDALAAILRALAMSPTRREALRKRGLERARTAFGWDAVARHTANLLEALAAARSEGGASSRWT